MSLAAARAVADAVLYEGYLLYPYRASAAKNRSRWQFGVLGPPAAEPSAFAEPPVLSMSCLLSPRVRPGTVTVRLRFLQVQDRTVEQRRADGSYAPVGSLTVAGETLLSWEEAVEHEITLPSWPLRGRAAFPVRVPGGSDEEALGDAGRIVRRRWPLTALVRLAAEPDGELLRLTIEVANVSARPVTTKQQAARESLVGTHLLVEAADAAFLSLLDPPPFAAAATARCAQDRCWPVLCGDLLLGAPIILYDQPRIAEQSPGALFDATEIDEILTLRVMTMTDAEKSEARATDPRARTIVDRCDAMTAEDLERLHGTRRPADDSVLIGGVRIAEGSLVRVQPSRRADAQDLFFAGQVARVVTVLSDVDDNTHVAVVLVDDPAADLHEWYGRYLYFAPEELEPLTEGDRAC
jgi:hypothetical protein